MGKVFHNELSVVIDASSPYTVESKSLKLFVNSFIHKRFNSLSEVKKILRKHLEKLTKSKIQIKSSYWNVATMLPLPSAKFPPKTHWKDRSDDRPA